MNVSLSLWPNEGIDVNLVAEDTAEKEINAREFDGGKNGTLVHLLEVNPPEEHSVAMAAIEALVDLNYDPGSICRGLEWLMSELCTKAYERGVSDAKNVA